jgi:hypothetical protein
MMRETRPERPHALRFTFHVKPLEILKSLFVLATGWPEVSPLFLMNAEISFFPECM